MGWVSVENVSAPLENPLRVQRLNWPWQKARGYLLRFAPKSEEGLLFVYHRPRRVVVHMLFVPFPLGIVWINEQLTVVGVEEAPPWRGVRRSPVPVQLFIEMAPERIKEFAVGHVLALKQAYEVGVS